MTSTDTAQAEGPSERREERQGGGAEIVFDSVTKQYPGRDSPAVDNLSFTIGAGEICMLVGPSGAGKTTALKLINRLIDFEGGDISIDGRGVREQDVTELRRGIGYVIQQIGLFPHMTIEANIGTVPRLLGWDKKRIRDRSAELLELVGLGPEYAKRYPNQLSGGQRQRVGLARALVGDPAFVVLDEPNAALDQEGEAALLQALEGLKARGTTVVIVSHQPNIFRTADKILLMRDGRLEAFGSKEAVRAHIMKNTTPAPQPAPAQRESDEPTRAAQ